MEKDKAFLLRTGAMTVKFALWSLGAMLFGFIGLPILALIIAPIISAFTGQPI